MRVTSKGQVTITQNVRESIGILPSETEIEFQQDENGRWYITKTQSSKKKANRFRTAHKAGNLTMSTDDIMALTLTSRTVYINSIQMKRIAEICPC
jgi:hypothetical protein